MKFRDEKNGTEWYKKILTMAKPYSKKLFLGSNDGLEAFGHFIAAISALGYDACIAEKFGFLYTRGYTPVGRVLIPTADDDGMIIEVLCEGEKNNIESLTVQLEACYDSIRNQRVLTETGLTPGDTVFVVQNIREAIQVHAVGRIAYAPAYDMEGDYINQSRADFMDFLNSIPPAIGVEENHGTHVNIVVSSTYFDVEGIRDICRELSVQCVVRGIFEEKLGEIDALKKHRDEFVHVLEEAKRTILSPFAIAGSSMVSSALYAHEIKQDGATIFTPRVSTGLSGLDSILDGGLPTGVTILAAEPGLGKTSLAAYIACNIACAGHLVLFYSQEMSPYELFAKSISRYSYERDGASGLKYNTVRGILSGKEGTSEQKASCYALMKLISPNLHLSGDLYSVDRIIREVDMGAKTVSPDKRLVIFVDYLQYMTFQERSTQENVKNNIRELRDMCKKYDVPAFVISSIARDGYQKPFDKKYLKESGNIESDAVAILGLQYANIDKEDFCVDNETEVKRLEIVVGKSRFGTPHGRSKLFFHGAWSVFTEMDAVSKSNGPSIRPERKTRSSPGTKKKS